MSGPDVPPFASDDPNSGAAGSRDHQRTKRQSKTDVRLPVDRRPVGEWFGSLGQLDFDVDFFEKLLVQNGDSVEVLRVLGELVSKKRFLQRAVEIDQRLVQLIPVDILARYNLACSLARLGCADEAIEALVIAIRLGYDDFAHMEVDPDLESLRGRADFLALLDRD